MRDFDAYLYTKKINMVEVSALATGKEYTAEIAYHYKQQMPNGKYTTYTYLLVTQSGLDDFIIVTESLRSEPAGTFVNIRVNNAEYCVV